MLDPSTDKSPVIEVSSLGKKYRLGVINRQMLTYELVGWWARVRGKEDPFSQVMEEDRDKLPIQRDFWALRDVSFSIRHGEVVGVMGRNGSGKSTLLKILSRITAPTAGEARLRGRVASLLEVGTGFSYELTGRENVYLNGSILGLKRQEIEERYESIAKFAEVEAFMETPVKRYSSGMRVRLAFAVAAHLLPEILILDEVLAVGDAGFQEKCLIKINEIKQSGATILFVSHNRENILDLCTRGLVLQQGVLVQDAPVREAVDFYMDTLHLKGAPR
jgi:lipopolysaccharide transport system ATP-binding protein